MDQYNNSPSYPYNNAYGYPPHVPPPSNQPYPPPSSGAYPPPGSGPYSYPHQSPHYPPPYSTQHSGHYNYHPYPPAPTAPPAPAHHHSSSLDYGYPPPPHGVAPAYPPHAYPPPATSSPMPALEQQSSFQYAAPLHYPHSWPERPLESQPSKVHDSLQRQDSVSSVSSSGASYDHGRDDSSTRPSAYPPIHDLLAKVNLTENHPSAPASPPAPASASASYHSGPNPVPSNYNAQGTIYGHPNSFSRWETESPKPTYPTSCAEPQNTQAMQVVPFSSSKKNLKVLLLHGNLDIWVYEAKNLPNMDMFHKTIGDMFGQMSNKITSDPYVSITVADAVIGRTYVISNNENPVWMQHFNVPVAHYAAEVQFLVKDDDIVGSQLMGTVAVPLEQIYGGGKIEGSFPILNSSGRPCKAGAVLSISVQYYPIDKLSVYHHGVGAGPEYYGVPGTYFPLRMGGTVTLYQDAHVPDGSLPNLMLDFGMQYVHGKCWRDICNAIRQARRLIYITGWSVWHKVRLVRDDASLDSYTLGDLLKSKSQEGVRVLLLVWDDPTSRSILGYKTDGVMATHDEETRSFFKHSSVKVLLCPRVAGKRHSWVKQREVGVIYTHHQKTVIVDADAGNNRRKIIAFVGGLDLCDGRYDTPEHPLFRTLQTVHSDDYHNPTYAGSVAGCPREPWHDLHSKIDGPAAYDVLTNFEERWLKASKPHGIKKLKTSYDDALLRIERMPEILGISDAPSVSGDDPNGWHVQIFRSIDSNSVKGFPKDPKEATMKNLVCGKNVLIDMSIHTAYVKAIRAAQHFIYIENQYFIGSSFNWSQHKDIGANNLIPMEIALKIAEKIRARERFAAYIVLPMWPEGNPTGAATQRILYWQNKTMQMMYETIYKALEEVGLEDAYSPQDYLNFYCLGNREAGNVGGTESPGTANTPQAFSRKNRRFMIYVHSKGMVVDDEYVILGSANINQRSLEGTRDTEIAMGAYQPHHTWARKQAISETNMPAELFPQYTTIEYESPTEKAAMTNPVFLFVIDTCVIEEEIGYLKSSLLQQVLGTLPENCLIGLITFGTYVHVHELGFGQIPKVYVFKGSKEVSKDQVLEQMGFFANKPKPITGVIAGVRDGLSQESISRFLLPASECEFTLNSILEELQRDPWPVPADQRAARCTGTALSVAAHLLGICVPGSGARIMAFLGGPSTEGPGAIVSKILSEPIRSHKDLDKDSAPLYHKAVKFYEGLSKQLVHQGHVLDVFACALEQVGLAELKVANEKTGGLVVLAESFGHSVFKDSLKQVFQSGGNDLGLSSNGIFEVNCSKDVKVQGVIGPCASLAKKGPLCSEVVVGQGNTTAWKMCGLDKTTSLCLIFEVAKKENPDAIAQSANPQFYFQFLTYYQNPSGQMRLRVTTLSRRWVAGPGSVQDLIAGFDQEAAAVVMSRQVSFKMETEADFDPIRWLDKSLIHICSRFGDYQKDSPSSFTLSPRFSIFPQFMFHLRRSQFVQVFGNSPDETAYFRMILNRENVANSVVMIQPSLITYSFQSGPEPVLLDVAAIAADRILLLDSFFTIVVFHGSTIAQWRKAGYHEQPEHQAFAQLLKTPREDAEAIIRERFPVPRLVICDQYGSQARFMLAKLNPSATYNSDAPPIPGGDIIFTDDVSFEVFLDHLQRLAVH